MTVLPPRFVLGWARPWLGTILRAADSSIAVLFEACATSGVSVGDAIMGGSGMKGRMLAEGRLGLPRSTTPKGGGDVVVGAKATRSLTERWSGTAGL